MFFPWNGTVMWLQEFIKKLNNCHPIIKFDLKHSKTSIGFLERTVYKNKEQYKLLTTVYCKPADCENFLHYTSSHPRSLIKSIPYSQALRLKKSVPKLQSLPRICMCQRNHKLRFHRKVFRYRISTTIRNWKERITSTKVERKRSK